MKYTATIDDASVYGITAARAAYNAQFPAEVEVTPGVTATDNSEAVPAVMGANPARLNTDEAYLDFVLRSAVQSWCEQYAPVVPPAVPVTQVAGIPQVVSKKQGRAQLKSEQLLAPVEAYIFSLPSEDDTRMAYEDAATWVRTDPSVVAMMTMLGKTDADADEFFTAAAAR